MSITFEISEAYKRFTKQTAIAVMRMKWGGRDLHAQIPEKFDSILILAQERYGDIIIMTPMIRKLRESYPYCDITVLGVTDIIDFLQPDINLNYVCNIKRADKQTRQKVFSRKYDLLFNTKDHPSFTFIRLSGKINARYKIGIDHKSHHGFFNSMLELDDALPTVEKNLSLLKFLGIEYAGKDMRPYIPEGPITPAVQKFVQKMKGKFITGINLNASNRTKEWGIMRWKEFLGRIKEQTVILSTHEYLENKQALENEFNHVIPSPPTATIFDVGYLVKHMHILVTPDTSLVHIASCFNTPIVALYRLERDLKKFRPLSEINRVVVTPTGSIDDIAVTEVLDLYHSALEVITEASA